MNQLNHKKISFIGGGNMAQALISGLLVKGVKPKDITVADPSPHSRQQLAAKKVNTVNPTLNTATDNAHIAIKTADVIVLAVKPQVMRAVVADFAPILDGQLLISVAAGLSTATLSQMLGGYSNVVRAMPNTPAMIQKGATGLYAADNITDADKLLAGAVMAASGLVSWVDTEAKLHAVTAISGSAPAYFFYMLEAMIHTGVEMGLAPKQAAALAMQTALGAAQMAIASDETPAELRHKVTSPNGTTQAAVDSLDSDAFAQAIHHAMQACYERSVALSAELGQ